MTARTHYFTFPKGHEFREYWVEVIGCSIKKAKLVMNTVYGKTWESCYEESSFMWISKNFPKGCKARHDCEDAIKE